jgi:hypothetical protein
MYLFRAIVLRGQVYNLEDMVVVCLSTNETYKGIIRKFFINVNRCEVGIFFQANYYDTIKHRRTNNVVKHVPSGKDLIKGPSSVYEGNDIRLVYDILHKLMALPVLGKDE